MPKTRDDIPAEPMLPMTDAQLAAWEVSRDIDAELLEAVRQFKRGEGRVVFPGVEPPRGLSVSDEGLTAIHFAALPSTMTYERGHMYLTIDHPKSTHNIPVLVVDGQAYGPLNRLPNGEVAYYAVQDAEGLDESQRLKFLQSAPDLYFNL
jgi:hypothetical protein